MIVPSHLSPATKLGHGAYRRFSVIIYVYLNKLIICFPYETCLFVLFMFIWHSIWRECEIISRIHLHKKGNSALAKNLLRYIDRKE